MEITCPHCSKFATVKPTRSGRFGVKCSQCGNQYAVSVDLETDSVVIADTVSAPKPTLPQSVGKPQNTEKAPETITLPGYAPATEGPPSRTGPKPKRGKIPAFIGLNRVIEELGIGALGTAYLAQDLTLGRLVALKTLRPDWASDDALVMRFTRDAYAAAQLKHHHLTRIHDLGQSGRVRYVSQEYVHGQTLGHLIVEQKPIDPMLAASYMLQAARGLKVAHEQGFVHRNIKPGNLLIDDQGLLKISDLGLVQGPAGSEPEGERGAGFALAQAAIAPAKPLNTIVGTPAYMAPEQVRDPWHVDGRADLYSLGCVFYELVTGRQPFTGRTDLEVVQRQLDDQATPAIQINKKVPQAISDLIVRLMAKRPEERIQSANELIGILESLLGCVSTAGFTPSPEQVSMMEELAGAYETAPTAKIRKLADYGLIGTWALFVLMSLLLGRPFLTISFLGLGLVTIATRVIAGGIRGQSALFEHARAWLLGARWAEWLTWLMVVIVVLISVWVLGMTLAAISFTLAGVLLGGVLHVALDHRAAVDRLASIEQGDQIIQSLRAQGIAEPLIYQFVKRYSGPSWGEFFQDLFGYETYAEVKAIRAPSDPPVRFQLDPKEMLISWLQNQIFDRRLKDDDRKLRAIVENGLVAQGVNLVVARRKSWRVAEAMVSVAAGARDSDLTRPPLTGVKSLAWAMTEAGERPHKVLVGRPETEESFNPLKVIDFLLNVVVGQRTRFLAGLALLAACLLWMHQNELVSSKEVMEMVKTVQETQDVAELEGLKKIQVDLNPTKPTEPLQLALVPGFLLGFTNSYGAGVAGLILIVSSWFRGWKMSLFAIPAAGVALLCNQLGSPIPQIGPLEGGHIFMAAGVGILVLGILFGRSKV